MNLEDSLKILRALAQGIDPTTGELIEDDHILSNPHVIRALFTAANAIDGNSKNNSNLPSSTKPKESPVFAGKAWAPDEEAHLIERFKTGMSIKSIAEIHGRSSGAISSRLFKLGLINDKTIE